MKSLISSKLIKAVKAAPGPGLELVLAMLVEGRLGLDEPVEGKLGLMDTLIDHAFYDGSNRSTNFSRNMIQDLFSPTTLDQWLDASDNQAFARKDRNGIWVPLALLNAASSPGTNKIGTQKGAIFSKKELDKWSSRVAQTLPDEFWSESGGAFLAKAFDMDLHATIHQAWLRTSPLSQDAAGLPALLHAKCDVHWLRFVEEGGDVTTPIEGGPLWKVLLEMCKQKPFRASSSFLGAFEDWLVQWACTKPEMMGPIQGLAQARVSSPLSYSPDRWVNLFKASHGDWTQWKTRKSGAVWACVAKALSRDFFQAMEANPHLLKKLEQSEYAMIKTEAAIQAFATASADHQPNIAFLGETIRSHGWHAELAPYAPRFARIPMDVVSAQSARKLVVEEASWFGPVEEREALCRSLFLMLPSLARESKIRLQAWLEIVSGEQESAWLQVGRGFASAIRGKMEDLQSVDRNHLGVVARDPEGMASMEEMAKHFAQSRRKEFNSWLESAKLEALSPKVEVRRSSLRL